jgi:hypothetical protein
MNVLRMEFTIHNSQFTISSQLSTSSPKLLIESLLKTVNYELFVASKGGALWIF